MSTDEAAIRDVIEQWVLAIQRCDLDGVLSGHIDDLMMFDVPPPYNGVRGMDAYRDSWPPFFEWISSGAIFELVELDVTAGDTVAYAYALLRCGTAESFATKPDVRLRVSMGLRKVDGRWLVAHEHHSFPMEN
jgi:uncharacterized protein (TIGR02246 family)